MHRFAYDDTVRVKPDAPSHLRPGQLASVVVVNREEDRRGEFLRPSIHTALSIPWNSTTARLSRCMNPRWKKPYFPARIPRDLTSLNILRPPVFCCLEAHGKRQSLPANGKGFFMRKIGHFIHGRHVPGRGNARHGDVFNPATGESWKPRSRWAMRPIWRPRSPAPKAPSRAGPRPILSAAPGS